MIFWLLCLVFSRFLSTFQILQNYNDIFSGTDCIGVKVTLYFTQNLKFQLIKLKAFGQEIFSLVADLKDNKIN